MEVWLFETEGEFLEFALMRMVFLETDIGVLDELHSECFPLCRSAM